jgi:uncharacterized protein YbcI
MPDPHTPPEPRYSGSTAAAISTAFVALLRDFTGRGPTHARTTFGSDMIVVTLRDCLTTTERALSERGLGSEVIAIRRLVQSALHGDMIATVEGLTGDRVEACFGDHSFDPDIAVEVFLMYPRDRETSTSR